MGLTSRQNRKLIAFDFQERWVVLKIYDYPYESWHLSLNLLNSFDLAHFIPPYNLYPHSYIFIHMFVYLHNS